MKSLFNRLAGVAVVGVVLLHTIPAISGRIPGSRRTAKIGRAHV